MSPAPFSPVTYAKRALRTVAPKAAEGLRRGRWRRQTAAEVFDDVYARSVWGVGEETFYSGGGSDSALGEPYANVIARELTRLRRGRP
jgi:hypothetical protein